MEELQIEPKAEMAWRDDREPSNYVLDELLDRNASSLITEDLASFLIIHLVVVAGITSLTELKEEVARAPGLDIAVDQVIRAMEDQGLLELQGDEIIKKYDHLDLGSNPNELLRFLPNLFRLAAKRVLKNEIQNPKLRRSNTESVRYYVLPDDPEAAKELRMLEQEFKAKVQKTLERSFEKGSKSSSLRFVGVFNCVLDVEDFE